MIVNETLGAGESPANLPDITSLDAHIAAGEQRQFYKVQYASYPDQEGFNDALMVVPAQSTHNPVSTILMNSLMINHIQKWGREVLGDLSAEITIKGWGESTLLGKNLIVTIKHHLVPTDTIYTFADPKWLGKFYILQDATMHMKRVEANFIQFFMFSELGCSIGNTKALAKIKFVKAT
jgi:hypothetical protein